MIYNNSKLDTGIGQLWSVRTLERLCLSLLPSSAWHFLPCGTKVRTPLSPLADPCQVLPRGSCTHVALALAMVCASFVVDGVPPCSALHYAVWRVYEKGNE
jgi:hypothetical protein